MKKKRKKMIFVIVLVFVVLLLLSGGIFGYFKFREFRENRPEEIVNDFLDKYKKLDKSVMSKISYEYDGTLNDKQKKVYSEAIKRQYERMMYHIVRVDEKDEVATVKVEVTVYDYNSCYNEAVQYVNDYGYRFSDDTAKMDYKLKKLSKCSDRITHEVYFNFTKVDDKWKMSDLNLDDFRKLNGSY